MPPRWFVANQSEPEDQGGFCDKGSQIHYSNQSEEETRNHAAVVQENGDTATIRDKKNGVDRYNTTTFDIDDQGYEHPSLYDPGR
jgi:hypothetical protein